jgi:hypothetical protein
MNYTTLNQIINQLEAVQQSHAQLNGFGFGEVFELSTQQENYPLMWANVLTSNISEKTLTLNFGIMILDIVSDDSRNERDTFSDTLSISQDVIAMLENPINDDSFLVGDSVTLEPLFEVFPDKVNGWLMTVAFELPFEANRCQVPLK